MKFSIPTIITMNYITIATSFNIPKDLSNVGRRDVMESIQNTAFGMLTTGSVVMTAPIGNSDHDIAFAAISSSQQDDTFTATNTADVSILMDGASCSRLSSSPTSLYMAQSQTPRQKIISAKTTIQTSWFAFIDSRQWSTLNSSFNTQNPIIRANVNLIVNANPNIPNLAIRRSTLNAALDNVKLAINQQDQRLARARTLTVVNRIVDFTNIAPLP